MKRFFTVIFLVFAFCVTTYANSNSNPFKESTQTDHYKLISPFNKSLSCYLDLNMVFNDEGLVNVSVVPDSDCKDNGFVITYQIPTGADIVQIRWYDPASSTIVLNSLIQIELYKTPEGKKAYTEVPPRERVYFGQGTYKRTNYSDEYRGAGLFKLLAPEK